MKSKDWARRAGTMIRKGTGTGRGPLTLDGQTLRLRCYPRSGPALRLAFHLGRTQKRALELTCLPAELEEMACWGYLHLAGAEPEPPFPMSKELAKHGRACRYVWTLAALEACGLQDTGGYEGAQVLGAYGGGTAP